MVWGVPEAWRQCYSSSMSSGKIVADGLDGWKSKVLQEVLVDLKTPFLRLISSLFKAYFMPMYALSRVNWAFLELPSPFSASLGPVKAYSKLFRKKTHSFQYKLHLHSYKELKSLILVWQKQSWISILIIGTPPLVQLLLLLSRLWNSFQYSLINIDDRLTDLLE